MLFHEFTLDVPAAWTQRETYGNGDVFRVGPLFREPWTREIHTTNFVDEWHRQTALGQFRSRMEHDA